jgi:choline-glycine betaine transporter
VNEIFATGISCCIALVGWIILVVVVVVFVFVVVVVIVMWCVVMMGDDVPNLSKYLRLLHDIYRPVNASLMLWDN